MPRWILPLLAIGAGILMVLAASGVFSPLVAFGLGLLGTLCGVRFAGVWTDASPPLEPIPAPDPHDPLPSAFGRALVEKLPTPLLIISRTGRVAYANPAAQQALPRLEPGAHFASFIRAPAFVEAVGETLLDGIERSFAFDTHQGRERSFHARVALLPKGGAFGPEAQVIVQIEDRTQTRRVEQLRSDFIANASHELRTPLASIIGYIETLQNHARNDEAARETFLGIMGREAGRMQRLVDGLMSLSRIELNEHVRPQERWSLNQIAAESAAAFQPLAAQQGVRLEIALPGTGGGVLGDRDQLYQVFTNLIDNAMKYGGKGATVTVREATPGRAHPNRHGITIADTGPGIAREHIHRLTERFYRVNVGASRAKGGSGLGLAIAKHILNRHEGRLEVTSTLGKGSAFTVWLPRGPEEDATVPAPVAEPAEGRRSA